MSIKSTQSKYGSCDIRDIGILIGGSGQGIFLVIVSSTFMSSLPIYIAARHIIYGVCIFSG